MFDQRSLTDVTIIREYLNLMNINKTHLIGKSSSRYHLNIFIIFVLTRNQTKFTRMISLVHMMLSHLIVVVVTDRQTDEAIRKKMKMKMKENWFFSRSKIDLDCMSS